MNRKEAYKKIRNNRFLKSKHVMIPFHTKDGKEVKMSARKFVFFVEEDLVRKVIKEITAKTEVKDVK